MARISKEELQKRKAELSKLARQELAKTEVMRFRLEPNNILKLCELAEQRCQHVGTMVRQWVLERMQTEMNPDDKTTPASITPLFNTVLHRIDLLETEVKRLSKRS